MDGREGVIFVSQLLLAGSLHSAARCHWTEETRTVVSCDTQALRPTEDVTFFHAQLNLHIVNQGCNSSHKRFAHPTELQTHGTTILERAPISNPALSHKILHYIDQRRRFHAKCRCRVDQPSVCMLTEIAQHPSLECRHSNRRQGSPSVRLHSQHQLKQTRL